MQVSAFDTLTKHALRYTVSVLLIKMQFCSSRHFHIACKAGNLPPSACVQVQVTAAVANFLVNEARRNLHEPTNLLQEQDLLIYNFCPEFTGRVSTPQLSRHFSVYCTM